MKLPKNIRQIGEVEEGKKVYVEDYVMTYVKHLAERGGSGYKAAVLLGQAEWQNNAKHVFINGAVEIKGFRLGKETSFSNETWSDVYDKIKTYFSDVEVVGWVFAKPGQEFKIDDALRKVHLSNFSGQDKAFMMYDGAENEESFFLYTGNHFKRLKGYYIYYEKNEGMQNYMVDGKSARPSEEELVEPNVRDMRKRISSRKEEKAGNSTKKYAQYVYGVGTVVAAVILIIGTSMLNGGEKSGNLEDAWDVIVNEATDPDVAKEGDDSKVTVETLNGELEKKGEKEEKEPAASTEAGPSATPAQDSPSPAGDTQEPKPQVQADPQVQATPEAEAPKPKATEPAKKKQTNADPYDYYVVRKGDTLSEISENLFSSIHYTQAIKELNNLSNEDKIYEGQKLVVPKVGQ